ncbi:MAG TPA: VTT domain-containing protein, partial [Phycisphaerales bacterium]|nr:VTT domain-containing protein [Phycisphaerales bacterium]
ATPEPPTPSTPRASAASNAASMAWLIAMGLLALRSVKPSVLEKLHLHDKPLWWFIVAAVAASVAWAVAEWASLKPFLARSFRVAGEMGFASVLGVLASVLPLVGSVALYAYIKPIAEWLRAHPEGVWIYLAGFIVLGGVALLPTYAQSALGGFAFGAAMGVPLALSGFAGAAVLGYVIAMMASPERVRRVVDRDARAAAVRRVLAGGGYVRQAGIVTLLRLPPTSPFALTNLVLAAAGVKLVPFVVGTLVGMAPRTVVAVVIGAGVKELTDSKDFDKAQPAWVWWAGIGVSIAVLAVIMIVAKRTLAGVLRQHGDAKP